MVTVSAPSSTATSPRKIAPYRPVRMPIDRNRWPKGAKASSPNPMLMGIVTTAATRPPVRSPRRLLFQLLGKTVNADWLAGGTMTEYYAKWHATTCPWPTSLNCGSEAGSVQTAGRPLSLYSGQRGAQRQPLTGCAQSNTPQLRRPSGSAVAARAARLTSVCCLVPHGEPSGALLGEHRVT